MPDDHAATMTMVRPWSSGKVTTPTRVGFVEVYELVQWFDFVEMNQLNRVNKSTISDKSIKSTK